MSVTVKANKIIAELADGKAMLGDIKKRAAVIKKDHPLAMALWASKQHQARLLAVLIFDKNQLTQSLLDDLAADMLTQPVDECNQLTDWLLANQLTKSKQLKSLVEQWENHPSPIMQRLFGYHQARLRWTGQTPPDNSAHLMQSIENNLANAHPQVQWVMNFCAAQIGIHEPQYRQRCLTLGEKLGLYKDEKVAKNCTPSYLPEFIRIEVAKRQG